VVNVIVDAVQVLQSARASERQRGRSNNSMSYLHYTRSRKIEDCLMAEEKEKMVAKELVAQ
jgi:hypothetical protein